MKVATFSIKPLLPTRYGVLGVSTSFVVRCMWSVVPVSRSIMDRMR